MSIEQHHTPHPATAEAGADFARVLEGLTRAVLAVPDAEPAAVTDPAPADQADRTNLSVAFPGEPEYVVPGRRPGALLHELGFLDD